MTEFFAMGGYAAYVWPSFGLTFAVMAFIQWSTFSQRRKAIAMVRREQQMSTQTEQRKVQTGGSA